MIWFFVSLALILLLILFLPINLDVFYDDNFCISVKILFFKYVVPLKKSKSKKQTGMDKKTKNESFGTKLSDLFDTLKTVKTIVLRSISIKLFKVNVVVCADDPCDTALLFGSVNALCYGIHDIFASFTKIKKSDINIIADYNGQKTDVVFNIVIKTYVFKFIVSLIKAVADGKIKIKDNKGEQ